MKYLLLLSKDNLELARKEAVAVLNLRKVKQDNGILLIDCNKILVASRLAYSKKIFKFLFESNKKDIVKKIQNFSWKKYYKRNFCVRILNFTSKLSKYSEIYSEKELADIIWRQLKNNLTFKNSLNKPKVDLENPRTNIYFIFTNKKVYATLLIKEIEHNFEQRKPHNRAVLYPVSLHPKLARAMVNLTSAKKGNIILDPFCGVGGILIEAGLLGMKPVGYDIDEKMVMNSKLNLEYYNIKRFLLERRDAIQLKEPVDYVVTDLPYARNTKIKTTSENVKISLKIDINDSPRIKALEKFYYEFLIALKHSLRKKAVIGFPDFINYKKLIRKSKLKIGYEVTHYLHKSLSKKIVVVEP